MHHELKPGDFNQRVHFCEWLLEKCRDLRFLANCIIGDEAAFIMNGEVNSQNVRQYAPRGEGPDVNYDLNDIRARICGNGSLLRPCFLEGNVNRARYLQMLNEDVFPELVHIFADQFLNGHFTRHWWVQDGAPPHCSAEVRGWLADFFRNHVIALNHDTEWPPRSPDLTTCDYFLWSYLKRKVYVTPPESLVIAVEIEALTRGQDLLRRAVRDSIRRANKCIEVEGRYIERLLEKK